MASYPPFDKFYVVSYAANDRDHPVIGIKKDPRVAGYRIPEDLSPHPDSKRYPNHVFTGAQPSSGDQIVTHIYEILPSPWVPFTRYDDDLGPIQGRRRSVKNEGQVATLAADKRVTYEAREGSAIVYTELEESWSIATDDDGNSLFPIRDRDFYDASRGPVQERRQLFVPTGDEEGSLENINGVITQTSYEPYNEFLSVKIVQTYKVDGPQLIGNATNEASQLVTVTTQRKGADGYVPPSPTATRTVEASREDAESIVERIIDAPEVFDEKRVSARKAESIPVEFRASVPELVTQEVVESENLSESIQLGANDIEKLEERITEFKIRTSTTSRDVSSYPTLNGQDYDDTLDVEIPYTKKIVNIGDPFTAGADVSPISDTQAVETLYNREAIRSNILNLHYVFPTQERVSLPDKLLSAKVIFTRTFGDSNATSYGSSGSFVMGSSAGVTGDLVLDIEKGYEGPVPAEVHVFFLNVNTSSDEIVSKVGAQLWPAIKPRNHTVIISGKRLTKEYSESVSDQGGSLSDSATATPVITTVNIPPTIHPEIEIGSEYINVEAPRSQLDVYRDSWIDAVQAAIAKAVEAGTIVDGSIEEQTLNRIINFVEDFGELNGTISPAILEATTPPTFPEGKFIISSDVTPYRYGLAKVTAVVVDVTNYV